MLWLKALGRCGYQEMWHLLDGEDGRPLTGGDDLNGISRWLTCCALTGCAPDEERFPATRLAREAATAGGAAPAVLNAANEVAVAAFLAGQIAFTDISALVAQTLDRDLPPAPNCLDDVLAVDGEARARTAAMLELV